MACNSSGGKGGSATAKSGTKGGVTDTTALEKQADTLHQEFVPLLKEQQKILSEMPKKVQKELRILESSTGGIELHKDHPFYDQYHKEYVDIRRKANIEEFGFSSDVGAASMMGTKREWIMISNPKFQAKVAKETEALDKKYQGLVQKRIEKLTEGTNYLAVKQKAQAKWQEWSEVNDKINATFKWN